MVRPRITPTKTLEILKPLLAKMSLEGVAVKPEYNRIWQSGEMTFAQLEATQDLIPDDDVFIVAHRMESPTPEHTHDFYEIACVLNGMVDNCVHGEDLYLPENSICIMNLASSHKLLVVDESTIIANVCLKRSLFDEGVFRRFMLADSTVSRFLRNEGEHEYLVFNDANNRALSSAVANLLHEYVAAGFRTDFSVEARTLLLLAELDRVESYSYEGIDAQAKDMLDYINERRGNVTVSDIALEFGYNKNYLASYFKRHTGKTASDTIRETRMAYAASLLRETDSSVEEVAAISGYQSYSHFHKAFSTVFGLTPGQYRISERYR